MIRTKSLTIERVITLLFAILPVLDSVNGILITRGLPSIGTIYKVFVLGVLLVFSIREGNFSAPVMLCCLAAVGYIIVSIFLNMSLLEGRLITKDFPIKLIFNILTLALLLNCYRAGYIDGRSIDRIFNISAWLMLFMILVPKALGLGHTIYSGGIGYKGFFYSNNELSVALLILFYYCMYRVTLKLSLLNLIQLGGITVCVLLLNTKSGMIACALGMVLFAFEYLRRKGAKYKGLLIAVMVAALYVAKDFIIDQVSGFMQRQSYLHGIYGGSILDTLVSGRTFLLEGALENLTQSEGFLMRVLLGNGFCSNSLVEMDFVDVFFYLGAVGVIALVVVLGVIFFKSIKNFRADGTWMRPFGYLMIIGFAFLAGHTVFMATSGCYFVLYLCFCLTYKPGEEKITDGC